MQGHLPNCVEKYSQSPLFDETSVPDALRRDHCTKAGVWGRIVVTSGSLIYLRDDRPAQILTADMPGVIYPQELHCVHPKGAVQFRVEFYRTPDEARP